MLGLHLRTTGDDRWNEPFDIVRDGENTLHVVPLRDRRAPARAVDRGARRVPLREHEDLAVLPRGRRPRPAAARPAARHRPPRGVRRWWNDVCRDQYLHLDGDELPTMVDAVLRPDPRRAPRGPGHVRDGPGDLPRAAGARRRAPAVRSGDEPARLLGAERPDRAARPARSATALWLAKEWGLAPLDDALERRRSTSTTSRRSTATAASSPGASTLDEEHPARSVQRDDGRGAGRDRGLVVAARERRARVRGSPSRRWRASTSRPSRSARRGGIPTTSTLTVTPVGIHPDTRGRTTLRITNIREPTCGLPTGRSPMT